MIFTLSCDYQKNDTKNSPPNNQDSLSVLSAISHDGSVIFKNAISGELKRLPQKVNIFSCDSLVIDRYFFKSNSDIFNYFVAKFKNKTLSVALNPIHHFLRNGKFSLSALDSEEKHLEGFISSLNQNCESKYEVDFILNRILCNTNNYEKISSFNQLYYYFDKSKSKQLRINDSIYSSNMLKIENILKEPFSNIYFYHDCIITIDNKEKVAVDFYFANYLPNKSLNRNSTGKE